MNAHCGNCDQRITYRITLASGLWLHDATGRWQCGPLNRGDANTSQIFREEQK
jgi:hypothetical protein